MQIVYKSEYSKACDLIGQPKPATQEEEDYVQTCEFEHPEMCAGVLSKMIGKPYNQDKFKWTFLKFLNFLRCK